jgi:carboxymethylenebutenolidase
MGIIELTSVDGHVFDAYEVHPEGATASVVIIQEIFGVNAHIRDVADSYAAEGYHVIAPALFDRVERGVELEYTAKGVEAGKAFRAGLDTDDAAADIAASIDHVASSGPVGVVGYCFGGSMAWLAAGLGAVSAAVCYYGGQIRQFMNSSPIAPVMLHYGALDTSIPMADVAAIREAYPGIDVYVYEDANHGFSCDARDSFHPEAAQLARERTSAFFQAQLS